MSKGFYTIPSKELDFGSDPMEPYEDRLRTMTRNYLPASGQGSGLNLVFGTGFSVVIFLLGNNSRATIHFGLSLDSGNEVLAIPDVALFADDVQVPSSAAGSGNYRVEGPIMTPYTSAGVAQGNHEVRGRVAITNLSGATRTIRGEVRFRGIINSGGVTEESVA